MTPRWRIETTEQFDREFKKLDRAVQRRVLAYLEEVEALDDPRQRGKGLTANHAGVWRYRVGDYRILTQISDDILTVLAIVATCTDPTAARPSWARPSRPLQQLA